MVSRSARLRSRLWARTTATVAVAAVAGLVLVDSPTPTAGAAARGTAGTGAGPATTAATAAPLTADDVALVSARWTRWPGHPGRRLLHHTVRRGDTATGLAVRYHAWTAELRAINHLGRHSRLYAGERIVIPVVLAAVRRDKARHHRPASKKHHTRHHRATKHHTTRTPPRKRPATHPWRNADASRATVRKVVVRTALRHRVKPALALAISWQESGWQQRRVSSAGAIGAMQVMPGTGRWVSTYERRPLNLYSLTDNVTAGVRVIRILKTMADGKRVIGAYYQGLGSIQEHGMYPSTKAYVRNVVHLRDRLRSGRDPY